MFSNLIEDTLFKPDTYNIECYSLKVNRWTRGESNPEDSNVRFDPVPATGPILSV